MFILSHILDTAQMVFDIILFRVIIFLYFYISIAISIETGQ